MFKEDHLSFRQRKYMKVKNIIGRALGGIGLVVLSPVYLAIIVAIKKEDGITAPVFFSQKRVGIHKEYFNLYKFRSMRTDTPHDKPTHLLENPDQYITKVGHFLRKSSLDELPQLWNIARGDMAVIGPRPALWNQDDLIAERDKYGANDVKPGLTGWAQINGRDELEIPVKARLDGEYVKKMGPLMDIRCFIGTVFSVLRSDGVVEGGTGAKKKLMVITNHSYMLWQFRRELIGKLMEDYDVIISTPFVGHEDDFKAMGCTMIETDVDRRGINPKTDMKLYLTYRRLLKEHHPDMVVTYSIKPNVYAGYACRQMRIPYCVNVQGLGTAFQKKGLREIVIRMYKTALKKAKTVYFENKGNAKVFLQEQIIRREQMCLLKGAGVNLKYYTYQKYPENDKVHFLYLGRIMKEKGMDELFYAAKELQRKEVPFVLDLVGFFEDEYKEKIDKLVDAGIAVFHGFQEDPRPYYAMADCVVLPSYHEGMGYTEHLFYLICHSFKHFLHSGFGIRQVCDIILFANEYGDAIDWEKVLRQCREIHADLFAAALFAIGEKYLTFDPEKAHYPKVWQGICVDETDMLMDLLDSGIYGNANMSRKHSSNMTLDAVAADKNGKKAGNTVLKSLFPSAKKLEGRYPYLKKHPILLPIAWTDRILKYRKETVAGGDNAAADSVKIGNQRIELMKEYGIIKNDIKR